MQDLNREINRWNKTNDKSYVSTLLLSDTIVGSDLVRPTLMGQPGLAVQPANGVESAGEELATVSLASPPPSFPKNAHVF